MTVLYGMTILLGAFLLFAVQPLIGKFILPWFGGGPGVWNTCMMFFQVGLVAGYGYAHVAVRLGRPRLVAIVHIVLLAASLAWLTISPNEAMKPGGIGNPSWQIMALLGLCVAGPYFALAGTSPLIAAWYGRVNPKGSPYRLYALSNVGSLVALLGYPFVFEPNFDRFTQASGWSIAYVVFAVLFAICAIHAGFRRDVEPSASALSYDESNDEGTSALSRFLWIVLPACASVLLLSTTARLSEEITPIPFLWVLPLAVYLLSFIVCFEWPRLYHRGAVIGLLILSYGFILLFALFPNVTIEWQIAIHLGALFACCMICHGEAYRMRPPARRLTSFYMSIAFGGALGGVLVCFIAPEVLTQYWEFQLSLYGTFILGLICWFGDPKSKFFAGTRRTVWIPLTAVVLGLAVMTQIRLNRSQQDVILRVRNFFGALAQTQPDTIAGREFRALYHGRIMHGIQRLGPEFVNEPIGYYGSHTGIARMLQAIEPATSAESRRIGVVGLGVGMLAAHGKQGDVFRFYEINPAIIQIANEQFTFLRQSLSDNEVVLGDARLSLERENPQNFDMLILDAFTGDAIPSHLLTAEAFELYERHLRPGGVIAIHISNVHLKLHLPLATLAVHRGWDFRMVGTMEDPKIMAARAIWTFMTRRAEVFRHPALVNVAQPPPADFRRVDLWTDDRVNLLQVLK
jgi:hypothetical protein